MEVKVCRGCRKMFQYVMGDELCPKCKQIEEELFQKVKEYLRQNPGANMYMVNQETGVSAKLLEKFLRQGRLEVAPDSPLAMSCERCGRKISTGRYCIVCKSEVTQDLNNMRRDLMKENVGKEESTAKMRFLKSEDLK